MDAKMSYKITIKSILKSLQFDIVVILLMLVILYIYNFESTYCQVFFWFYIITSSFGYWLLFEYFYLNYGKEYYFESDKLFIKTIRNGVIEEYNFDLIRKIYLCRSMSIESNGIKFSSMEGYYFYKIDFKDNRVVYLTSVLSPSIFNLHTKFKGKEIIRKRSPFCSFLVYS